MWQGLYQGLEYGKAGTKVPFGNVTICGAFGVDHLPGSGTSTDTSDVCDLGRLLSAASRDLVCVNETLLYVALFCKWHQFFTMLQFKETASGFTAEVGMQRPWDTCPLLIFFSLVPVAGAGLCSPSHEDSCGEDEEGDIGMAAPSVLTWPSLFFTTDCKEEDEICTFFQMWGPFLLPLSCGPEGPNSCLLRLQTSNSAASHFTSSRDRLLSFQPSHLLFWKSRDNCPFTYLSKKRREGTAGSLPL